MGDWLGGIALAGTLLSFGLLIFLRSRITPAGAEQHGVAEARFKSEPTLWNRRFDCIHAQSVCSNRPYPTPRACSSGSWRRGHADVRGEDDERFRQKRQTVHRPAWGACMRERQRAGAERMEGVAARWLWPRVGEWDPRQEEPRIVSLRVARNGIDSVRNSKRQLAIPDAARPQRSCRAGATRRRVLPERGPCVFDP